MSDEFAKGYYYGNYVTKNFPYNLPIIRDMERFSINNFHQTIPFTGNPKLTAGYDKGVEDMTLALKNKPAQGEKMNINELMQKLASQPVANTGVDTGMQQAAMMQAANEMRALQEKGAAGNGILSQDEINRFVYLRNMLNPNLPQQDPVGMPTDIDGASAGGGMSQKELDILLQQIQRMR
jgi:hypothetical protein